MAIAGAHMIAATDARRKPDAPACLCHPVVELVVLVAHKALIEVAHQIEHLPAVCPEGHGIHLPFPAPRAKVRITHAERVAHRRTYATAYGIGVHVLDDAAH